MFNAEHLHTVAPCMVLVYSNLSYKSTDQAEI